MADDKEPTKEKLMELLGVTANKVDRIDKWIEKKEKEEEEKRKREEERSSNEEEDEFWR